MAPTAPHRSRVIRVGLATAGVWALQGLPALFLEGVVYASSEPDLGRVVAFWIGAEWVLPLPVLAAALWFASSRPARGDLMMTAVRATLSYAAYTVAAGCTTVALALLAGAAANSLMLLAGPAALAWTATSGALLVGIALPTAILHPLVHQEPALAPPDADAVAEDALIARARAARGHPH